MKKILITLATILTATLAYNQAPNTWTRKADFGGGITEEAVGFSIGSKGYVGIGGGYTQDFWEYDLATDVWTQKANFRGTPRHYAAGFSIGDKGYVGTGVVAVNSYKKDFWEYDPATNTWTRKADFGGEVRYEAVGFSIGNKGYIGTGTNGGCCPFNNLKDFWEYDPVNDSWTRKADFGGGVRTNACGFSIDNKGYIGTGNDPNNVQYKDFWEFDPTADSWTQKADFGGQARQNGVGFSIGSKGYIGTGVTASNYPKDFWEYDPASDSWTRQADFEGTGRGYATAFVIDGKGYVGIGFTGSKDLKDFWEYTPDTQAPNTWTQKADFGGMARAFAVGFSIGNKGYIGTGSDASSIYKDFWEYDPNLNVWTQKADFGGAARDAAVGLSIGNKGYIGTGSHPGGYYKDFWEYDPAVNTWTRKADFGGTARNDAVGFSIGSKGYLGMGITFNGGNNYYKDIWEYDPVTNSWTQKADVGGTTRQSVIAFSIGSKGYLGTGFHYPNSYKDFWEYDPAVDAWTQRADVGGATRAGAVGFSIDNKGYVGTGGTADFWEYDPSTNTWTQKANFGGTARQFATGFSIGSKGYIGTGGDANGDTKDFWEYTPDACNGLTVYADKDSDGYGNPADTLFVTDCKVPKGYVLDSTDCGDTNASIHPGATEIPGDGIDNNCNGQVDENNGLSFDGVDDYVNINNTLGNFGTGDFTVELQVKTSTSAGQYLISKRAVCGGSNFWNLHIDNNRFAVELMEDKTGTNYLDLHGGATVNDGQWHHLTVTRTSGFVRLYVDGLLDASGNGIANLNNTTSLQFGTNPCDGVSGKVKFLGSMDEVSIWNIARTQTEIQGDMHSVGCKNADGLVAYYSFNQGTAYGDNKNVVTAYDITSNHNNGTLNNFKLTGSKSNWVKGVPGLNDSVTLYWDADGDTYGNAAKSIRASVCKLPAGYVYDSTDCNDADSSIHPGAVEVINGIDDNCNGLIDEGNWSQKAIFSKTERYGAIAFTYGSKAYFGLGKTADGEYLNDFWEYDPVTDAWTQKVNFKGSKRFKAVAFSIGPKGYVGTGCDLHGSLVRDFWEYDIATNTWTRKADFGGTGRQSATGFSIGNKGYISTGADYLTQHNDFWEYNPATNKWTRKANAGHVLREAAVGFSIGKRGYIGTGYDNKGGYKKDLWEYDPFTDSWTRKADFAGRARNGASAFVLYDKGYVGTGWDGNRVHNDFWSYDPVTDSWNQIADFSGKARAYAVAFAIGNYGYVGTGGNLLHAAYRDFRQYSNDAGVPIASVPLGLPNLQNQFYTMGKQPQKTPTPVIRLGRR